MPSYFQPRYANMCDIILWLWQGNVHGMWKVHSSVSNDTTANLNESDARATGFGISSAQRSSSVNVSAMHANRYMNQKRHYPRRPVTIIRRAVPNKNNKRMNPMMRASSAMFTPTNRHSFSPNQNPYTHNKIGLFDGDSLMTSQLGATPRFRADVKDSVGSGWDFLERSLLFGIQIQITHGIGDII
eukprot:94507_1